LCLTFVILLFLNQWILSPSDYPLLPALKQYLGGHKFEGDREIQTAVTLWLTAQDADSKSTRNKESRPTA
jgi:hypothetical protein